MPPMYVKCVRFFRNFVAFQLVIDRTSRSTWGPLVKIVVGTPPLFPREYKVHKGLLCHFSPYFRGVFDGGFLEAHQGFINLPEEEAQVVADYLVWLYTRAPTKRLVVERTRPALN